MQISVTVGLLSGKAATLEAGLDEDVGNLKHRAQTALGAGRGRLLDAAGSVLDVRESIKRARLQSGNSLTLHISRAQVRADRSAFAASLGDGSVVTWGNARHGGDSSAVQDQLKNAQQIQASDYAFAAILYDGSVVTWGDVRDGGSAEQWQQIQASARAFAAILEDGSIQASCGAFAAILGDGSVVTWGDAESSGDCGAVQGQLNNVQQIQASARAFAALLGDGSVVTWGDASHGGDCSAVQGQLNNVQQIQASARAFAAILDDGSVVAWGDANRGGDSSAVQHQLKKVQQIQPSRGAFAAIVGDDSVVTWGSDPRNCTDVEQLKASDIQAPMWGSNKSLNLTKGIPEEVMQKLTRSFWGHKLHSNVEVDTSGQKMAAQLLQATLSVWSETDLVAKSRLHGLARVFWDVAHAFSRIPDVGYLWAFTMRTSVLDALLVGESDSHRRRVYGAVARSCAAHFGLLLGGKAGLEDG
eukprot:s326_g4.t1